MKIYDEKYVRDLRDKCYGAKSSDENWDWCRKGWMTEESVEWLKSHQPKGSK